jgi:surfactin synthase thioesterase subunit
MSETYTYVLGDPLPGPISAFGGLQDEHVPRADLEAWRTQTTASCLVRMFPGDHFFVNTARPLVLRMVARELDQLLRTGSPHDVSALGPAA